MILELKNLIGSPAILSLHLATMPSDPIEGMRDSLGRVHLDKKGDPKAAL